MSLDKPLAVSLARSLLPSRAWLPCSYSLLLQLAHPTKRPTMTHRNLGEFPDEKRKDLLRELLLLLIIRRLLKKLVPNSLALLDCRPVRLGELSFLLCLLAIGFARGRVGRRTLTAAFSLSTGMTTLLALTCGGHVGNLLQSCWERCGGRFEQLFVVVVVKCGERDRWSAAQPARGHAPVEVGSAWQSCSPRSRRIEPNKRSHFQNRRSFPFEGRKQKKMPNVWPFFSSVSSCFSSFFFLPSSVFLLFFLLFLFFLFFSFLLLFFLSSFSKKFDDSGGNRTRDLSRVKRT